MKLNFEKYKDQVYACWVGKNIGGTMGTPYEGKREYLDIHGFATKPNEVLPNDDLDLQLVWLHSIERAGIAGLDCKRLGENWCSFIVPFWNEYGIGKLNMQNGLPAPISGDYLNSWKHSNGAWIRTEIWACLAPGAPEIAAKYAAEDAKADHGSGEGTVAASFVAAMQSAAFVIKDIRKCIEAALHNIPENSRTAKSIVKLLECFENGMSAKDARNVILELNKDIGDGWFEAPSNVAYTVLGLLWGAGDFKKSMISAINCGDDTDCTGATVGATLGILGGTSGIPEDWKDYLGDDIVTVSINKASGIRVPKNCTELTERVVKQAPVMLVHNWVDTQFTDGENEIPEDIFEKFMQNNLMKNAFGKMKEYSFVTEMNFCNITAVYDGVPEIKPGESKKITLIFENNTFAYGNSPYNLSVRWLHDQNFSVSGPKEVRLPAKDRHSDGTQAVEYVITAGENVLPVNRIVAEVVAQGRPTAGYVSVVLMG